MDSSLLLILVVVAAIAFDLINGFHDVMIYTILFEMDTDFKTFHQLKSIIERLKEVADKAADNAETIRLIAIRHMEFE